MRPASEPEDLEGDAVATFGVGNAEAEQSGLRESELIHYLLIGMLFRPTPGTLPDILATFPDQLTAAWQHLALAKDRTIQPGQWLENFITRNLLHTGLVKYQGTGEAIELTEAGEDAAEAMMMSHEYEEPLPYVSAMYERLAVLGQSVNAASET